MVDVVKISKALSDQKRYRILKMLVEHEATSSIPRSSCCSGLCNCEIMAALHMIQSRVSYHMKELVDAGLVIEAQRGKWKYYILNRKTLQEYILTIQQDLFD